MVLPNNTENVCSTPTNSLTNENILDHIQDHYCNDGSYTFFYVTKPAVIDYSHIAGNSSSCQQTLPILFDLAGNSMESAKRINGMPALLTSGRIDYLNDVDYYVFEAVTTKNYQFQITNNGTLEPNTQFTLEAFDEGGISLTATPGTTITFAATGGKLYYVKVSCSGQTSYSVNQKYFLTWY
jgi:hypothetical protein